MTEVSLRAILTDAIRYWERRRITYNIVLAGVTIMVFAVGWAEGQADPYLLFAMMPSVIVLAVLANVAYCAAYAADIMVQYSEFRAPWLRYRWILFVIGLLFAAMLAYLFASGLFLPLGVMLDYIPE